MSNENAILPAFHWKVDAPPPMCDIDGHIRTGSIGEAWSYWKAVQLCREAEMRFVRAELEQATSLLRLRSTQLREATATPRLPIPPEPTRAMVDAALGWYEPPVLGPRAVVYEMLRAALDTLHHSSSDTLTRDFPL